MNTDKNDETSPYTLWRQKYPVGTLESHQEIRIQQWLKATSELLELFRMFDDDIEPWLNKRESSEPDLIAFIAGYGHSRTLIGDWKDLPIDIPAEDVADWEENSGFAATLEQLHDYQAGVAGSVPEMLHTDQDEVITLIKKQLAELYDELNTLVAKPIAEFTPTQWENEDIGMDYQSWEIKELDRIFDVYEKLWCFEQGIEELRMLMITEDDPEFHLPNVGFYESLKSINSHELMSNLAKAEPKLREVLKLWSNTIISYTGKPYHRPYDNTAPKIFWWRHKNGNNTPRRSQNSLRNNSQNNRRPNQNRRPNK